MQIISDFSSDIRNSQKPAGGYEWWYFDAVDEQNSCRFVVIFYEGNPFSTRYIRKMEVENAGEEASPRNFPAVSISVYQDETPVYYSFTEFGADDAGFDSDNPEIQIGKHRMKGSIAEEKLIYRISLEETLPSGDAIRAEFNFESSEAKHDIFGISTQSDVNHTWNLVQPRAEVKGRISLSRGSRQPEIIDFRGTGYHDHNVGLEPMWNEFEDWYWGRFHFRQSTLVYFAMNRKGQQQYQGWLISKDNNRTIIDFDNIALEDKGLTIFGLNSARRIVLSSEKARVTIQQAGVLDNGPFYQRFYSDAFLAIPGQNVPEAGQGISEYLRPACIYRRLFWPLVNMRIRFKEEQPHWVQKSQTLYRWTW